MMVNAIVGVVMVVVGYGWLTYAIGRADGYADGYASGYIDGYLNRPFDPVHNFELEA